MINKQYQCDYCFGRFSPEFITLNEYPETAVVIYKIYIDQYGKHMCDKCFEKIKEKHRNKWQKERSQND